LYPALQHARLALWEVHAAQDDHQAALAVVLSVPPSDRLFRQARFRAAVSLLRIGMYGEAHIRFTELNRTTPDPALLNDLGVVQLRRPAGAPGGAAVDYFKQAASLDEADPDLFFNLGYASWLQHDVPSAINWLREAVRRNPADYEAHYVLGVALQASGSAAEATREKDLAKQLSSVFEEWEAKQPGADSVPRGLERVKTEVDVPASMRVESVIVAAEQRDQRKQALFHLDAGRRLYQSERDDEAIAELRRAVYLSPYESSAHLLLGRIYLRGGRIQDAIDALKISIWSDDTVAARLALAEAFAADRENAAARAELQRVLKRDPSNEDARRILDRLPSP
jgi:tetratricopeptide (TPR) repeat protein